MRFLLRFAWIVCVAGLVFGQKSHVNDPQVAQKMLNDAAAKGQPVKSTTTVGASVTASAVLIPQSDVRRIFGKETATKYAVIEVNLGNKSSDAALIIHEVFIDYTQWALAGSGNTSPSVGGLQQGTPDQFQANTSPNQIASEEYRVVRGQLLDAQLWSARNWTVRLLTLAAGLAGGYSFAFKEKGIAKGIAAFSGVFVPGVEKAWPDDMVDQINRVSDFGYSTNKVVAKQGAEIIVCFFPIDRFLTPGFRKLFMKSPALFFAPFQMLLDQTIQSDVTAALGENFGGTVPVPELRKALPCYLRVQKLLNETQSEVRKAAQPASEKTAPPADETAQPADGKATQPADAKAPQPAPSNGTMLQAIDAAYNRTCLAQFGMNETGSLDLTDKGARANFARFLELDYISQMSLNSVHVTIDGVMTVDTTSLAAKPESVKFDAASSACDETMPCLWADLKVADGVRTGVINGSYLTGGKVTLVEANDLGITELKTVTEGSTDQILHFSFKLTKPIPSGTKMHFKVDKTPPAGQDTKTSKPAESQQFEYVVGYKLTAPAITNVKLDSGKLTVTGTGFYDIPKDNLLATKLHPPSGTDVAAKPKSSTTTDIELDLPSEVKAAGCWEVLVSVGSLATPRSDKSQFPVSPAPQLESAKRSGSQIIVAGKDLIDTSACGGPALNFQLVKDKTPPIDANAKRKIDSPQQITLVLPDAAKEGSWSVQVLLGKDVKSTVVLK
jgi:hypothetical protein